MGQYCADEYVFWACRGTGDALFAVLLHSDGRLRVIAVRFWRIAFINRSEQHLSDAPDVAAPRKVPETEQGI